VSFLLLVSHNNPGKTWQEIARRSDVKSAMKYIEDWTKGVRKAAETAVAQSPHTVSKAATKPLDRALTAIVDDTDIVHHDEWKNRDHVATAAQLNLRVNWIFEWLRKFLLWLLGPEMKWKVWVSRLAPNSCQICVSMHGTTVGISDSFGPALAARGGKPYAGTLIAHGHPRCQCKTFYLSDEQVAAGFIPKWDDPS